MQYSTIGNDRDIVFEKLSKHTFTVDGIGFDECLSNMRVMCDGSTATFLEDIRVDNLQHGFSVDFSRDDQISIPELIDLIGKLMEGSTIDFTWLDSNY